MCGVNLAITVLFMVIQVVSCIAVFGKSRTKVHHLFTIAICRAVKNCRIVEKLKCLFISLIEKCLE